MIALSDSLTSLLNVETPPKFFVVMALISCVACVVMTVIVQLGRLARHQADLEFKRDLVERGLSVDEIERIVSAKPISNSQPGCRQPAEAEASVARG